jgi:alkylation response protein AidB-like acyl-CoA dehydrogenase
MVPDAVRESRMQEMIARVAPVIRSTAATSESARKPAPEVIGALIDARIPRALLPARYKGAELGAVYGVKLCEELAQIDSTAAWVSAIAMAGAWFTVVLPESAADEMLADPKALLLGSLFPPLTATSVQGGYRVSGRTSFASGCQYATWLGCQAVVMEDGRPKFAAAGMPELLLIFLPAGEAEVIENWNTLGMRGTGSHDYQVADSFIPENHCWRIGPYAPVNPQFSDPLSRMGIWWFGPLVASVGVGVARAAIDDLLDLAQNKTPSYTQTGLADKPVVQDKVARARAFVDAARSYLYESLAGAEELLETQPRLNPDQGIPLALSASFATEAAVQAVDLVHSCAGTAGIREEQPFQRYFRDVHTLSQHAFASPSRFESIGKLMLGRESDWPFYAL